MSILHAKPMVAAMMVSLLVQGNASAQVEPGTKMILELSPEDTRTISAEEIVKRCSEILEHKNKHGPETIANILSCRGEAYHRLELFDAALTDLDTLCELRPRDAKARSTRGATLACMGRPTEALADGKAAIELDPKSAPAHARLGYILFRQGKLAQAHSSVKEAIRIDPDYGYAYYVRAMIALWQGDAKDCLAMVNRFIEYGPFPGLAEPSDPYILRARALTGLCRPRESLNNYLMARNLSPSSLVAADGGFNTYSNLNKLHMAARAGEELVRLNPDCLRSRVLCAFAHARVGNKNASIKMLEKAWSNPAPIGEDPATEATNFGYAARAHFHLGQYAKASVFLDHALNLDENCDAALFGKALMLACCPEAKYRDGAEALRIAERIREREKKLKRDERHQFRVYELLADAHAECGNYAEAITSARKAIELAGPDRDHDEFEERIKLFEKNQAYRYVVAGE